MSSRLTSYCMPIPLLGSLSNLMNHPGQEGIVRSCSGRKLTADSATTISPIE
jgi:hypothetical protein